MHRTNKTQKYWGKEEEEYLKRNYTNTPNQIMAECLNRTVPSISLRASLLGLVGKPRYHRVATWHYLKDNPFEKLLDWEKGYIAGMLDGEGSIIISKRKNVRKYRNPEIYIQIVNTNEEVIHWLKERLDGTFQIREDNAMQGHLPLYLWLLHGLVPCHCLLQVLFSMLIIKRARAEEVLDMKL